MMDTLILSVQDIRHIVGCIGLDELVDEVIDTLETVCLGHDKTILEIPARAGLVEDHGLLEWMPVGERGRHATIKLVGSDFPGKTELPLSLLQRSLVAVDFLPQAQKEGEAQQLQKHEIGPDLMQLLQGAEQFAGHRIHATVFDSTGFALEDHAVIEVLCNHARALGCSSLCAVETMSQDPCDPYGFLEESADRVETADQLSAAP